MKFSWKNIENWWSWKMRFFLSRPFWILFSRFFFLLYLNENKQSVHMLIIYFCTMHVFFRILEKTSSELICTRHTMQKSFDTCLGGVYLTKWISFSSGWKFPLLEYLVVSTTRHIIPIAFIFVFAIQSCTIFTSHSLPIIWLIFIPSIKFQTGSTVIPWKLSFLFK